MLDLAHQDQRMVNGWIFCSALRGVITALAILDGHAEWALNNKQVSA
jgi:hypothetical protein